MNKTLVTAVGQFSYAASCRCGLLLPLLMLFRMYMSPCEHWLRKWRCCEPNDACKDECGWRAPPRRDSRVQFRLSDAVDASISDMPAAAAQLPEPPAPALTEADVVSVRTCNDSSLDPALSTAPTACAFILDVESLDTPFPCQAHMLDSAELQPSDLQLNPACFRLAGGIFPFLNGMCPFRSSLQPSTSSRRALRLSACAFSAHALSRSQVGCCSGGSGGLLLRRLPCPDRLLVVLPTGGLHWMLARARTEAVLGCMQRYRTLGILPASLRTFLLRPQLLDGGSPRLRSPSWQPPLCVFSFP